MATEPPHVNCRITPVAGICRPEVTNLEQGCRTTNPHALTPAQVEAHNATWDRLFRADHPYRQKLEAVTSGLSNLSRFYAKERNMQGQLIRSVTNARREL